MKTILILVDGLRPDALDKFTQGDKLKNISSYTLKGQTVMPSVTLPCHMSLFHSVDPSRHGTTTNTYMPQVRPINGLCEVLKTYKKKSCFYYNWEELRDIARPGSLMQSVFYSGSQYGWELSNNKVTKAAVENIKELMPDFAFVYLGYVDEAGHASGWMSEHYFKAVKNSLDNIEYILNHVTEDYTVIITADHGGHDRTHGTDKPEDMTIPVFFIGRDFTPGEELVDISMKDIAPTITAILNIPADEFWEGRSIK